jgi:hypothetical protein
MKETLDYAIETLRNEYYRLALVIRAVPIELYAAGYNAERERDQQRQVVEALLILGADVTTDMQMLRESLAR